MPSYQVILIKTTHLRQSIIVEEETAEAAKIFALEFPETEWESIYASDVSTTEVVIMPFQGKKE